MYGREARRGKMMANANACREKACNVRSRGLAAAYDGDDARMLDEHDLQVEAAVHTIQGSHAKARCKTCRIVKEGNHPHSTDPEQCCRQCATA